MGIDFTDISAFIERNSTNTVFVLIIVNKKSVRHRICKTSTESLIRLHGKPHDWE